MNVTTVKDFLGFEVGDILKLSDLDTQTEFGESSVSFKIKERRKYEHDGIGFVFTGYVVQAPNKEQQDFMLMIKEVGNVYDLLLFYMDGCGEITGTPLLDKEGGLVDYFETSTQLNNKEVVVPWNRQGPTIHGVVLNADLTPDLRSIGNYHTASTEFKYPYLFVEWTGDEKTGFFEMWFGSLIQASDLELLKVTSH